jgi:hypothetical protein
VWAFGPLVPSRVVPLVIGHLLPRRSLRVVVCGQVEAERMVTRSGKHISLTDWPIRVPAPAPLAELLPPLSGWRKLFVRVLVELGLAGCIVGI